MDLKRGALSLSNMLDQRTIGQCGSVDANVEKILQRPENHYGTDLRPVAVATEQLVTHGKVKIMALTTKQKHGFMAYGEV